MGQNFSSEPVVEKETERDHNDVFNVAVSSCQGWRMSQEDNHSLILDLPGEHKAAFFAVYDGHGSAKVSKHASESLWRHLVENDLYTKGNFKEALEQAFLTFDREVNESYNAQLAGTTAVCLLIADNIIYCANIGDSRGVASVNCECIPLSYDHKPENPQELKRILAAGGYVLGNRVNGNLALSRAFGDFHYKGNEQLPPDQQIVSPCPDIKMIELNDDVDFLVLACDGIWDVLSSEEVVEFVIARIEQSMEPGLICEQLTTRCLATDYELVIGCDNMTVLLICYTRGRSWVDFCTDIFNKNTRRLGVARTRPNPESENNNTDMIDTTIATNRDTEGNFERINPGEYYNILNSVFVSDQLNTGTTEESSSSNINQNNNEDTTTTNEGEQKESNDGNENLVLQELDKEPELEEAITISDEPSSNQNNDNNNKQEQCSIDGSQEVNSNDVCKKVDSNDETSSMEKEEVCQQDKEEASSDVTSTSDNNTDQQQCQQDVENSVDKEEVQNNEDNNDKQDHAYDEQQSDSSNSDIASQNNEVEVES